MAYALSKQKIKHLFIFDLILPILIAYKPISLK
jgi:hypothetical protein